MKPAEWQKIYEKIKKQVLDDWTIPTPKKKDMVEIEPGRFVSKETALLLNKNLAIESKKKIASKIEKRLDEYRIKHKKMEKHESSKYFNELLNEEIASIAIESEVMK